MSCAMQGYFRGNTCGIIQAHSRYLASQSFLLCRLCPSWCTRNTHSPRYIHFHTMLPVCCPLHSSLLHILFYSIHTGEKNPALHHSMMSICQMYPKELVNRCSPSYMKQLVDKFKRESMKSVGPTLPEESVDCITDDDDGSASV